MKQMKIRDLALLGFLSFWALGNYGGCSCHNTNPLGPTGGGGVSHGAMVDDFTDGVGKDSPQVINYYIDGQLVQKYFNGPDPAVRINLWGAGAERSVDTLGVSAYNTSLVSPGSDGSGGALRFWGIFGTAAAAPPYPFVAHRIYLDPMGKAGYANALAYGSTGLRLKVRRNPSVPNNMVVKVIIKDLLDFTEANPTSFNAYHFHSYTITPLAGGAWSTISTPYSSMAWGGTWGADAKTGYGGTTLASALCRPGGVLQLVALQFEPSNPAAFPANAAFDFNIDDIQFY